MCKLIPVRRPAHSIRLRLERKWAITSMTAPVKNRMNSHVPKRSAMGMSNRRSSSNTPATINKIPTKFARIIRYSRSSVSVFFMGGGGVGGRVGKGPSFFDGLFPPRWRPFDLRQHHSRKDEDATGQGTTSEGHIHPPIIRQCGEHGLHGKD